MGSSSFSLFPGGSTGSNQYSDTSYPTSMFGPSVSGSGTSSAPATAPGIVPPASSPVNPSNPYAPYPYDPKQPSGALGGLIEQPGQGQTVSTLYPNFTNEFYNYLSSQMGQGATPFNLSANLPSSGGVTAPGTLTAPLTDVNQMLENFYKTGTGGPTGSDTLAQMAKTGSPTDVGPAWEAMKAAQARTIAEQGANLREQFAFGGNLKSSPFGQAATDFYSQTAKDQNAALLQAQQQASEAAAGRQLSASGDLNQQAQSMGAYLQGLDQASIQSLLAEFIRTRPEYAPLLQTISGAATTFPPSISGNVGVGGMGGAAAASGAALQGISDLWSTISKSSSGAPQAGGASGGIVS